MPSLDELIGESAAMEAVRDTVRRLLRRPHAGRRLPALLIEGETGTGKGLLARAIHRAGPRSAGPFVDVNCAAIPETLLEAELFGFERGAFTDARHAKPGLFQAAQRGTIFLDEVGLLPESLQAKLLKVIEDGSVRRLGSTRSEPVDAWVLSATNADLAAAVAARRFREDLFHRLAVIRLSLPPLRERERDVLLLAEHYLARACEDYGLAPRSLSPDARAALLAHPWPGNVRELGNLMERVALLADGAVVTREVLDLPAAAGGPAAPAPAAPPGGAASLEQAMREHLRSILEETGWNISRSAAALGISRNTLRARIERFGLRSGGAASTRGRPPGRPRAPAPPAPTRHPSSPMGAGAPLGASAAPAQAVPSVVRWERRRVTLLRADLTVSGDPLAVPDTSRVLDVVMDKIRAFDGRVLELSANWVGAAFGLEAVEDAPRRAVHAAMAIQKAAERGRRGDGEPFAATIGIHVGQVLVGQARGDHEIDAEAKRREWAVLDALLAGAEPDVVLITEAAAPLLERRFDIAPRDGRYRLVGRERAGFAHRPHMVRFVNRVQELELIRSRLEAARAGHGQVIGIAGEAGIGKSRLLWEFRHGLRHERVTYLEGRCLSYGSAIPFLPVLEILRRGCRIADRDTPEMVTVRLREGLRALGMDPDADAPVLLQLLGIKEGTEALAGVAPEGVLSRIQDTLRRMTVRASRARPLIIAIEDAHWMDQASQGLAMLIESLEGVAALVILTYRPGFQPPWMQRSHVTQIALPPLSPEDSLSVVESVLRPGRVPEPLPRMILARGEGNPFFLEEMAQAVVEQGDLSSSLAVPASVPASVEELLLARIDRLREDSQRLLQIGAVIGREVPLRLAAAVWDRPEGLEDGLRELARLEFLYERPTEGERVYVFRHALTQEVAYGSVLPAQLRALHGRVGRALEEAHAGRVEEAAELLAHHFARSADDERAVDYALLAAEKAQRRWANAEALVHFDGALARLAAMADTRPNRLRRLDAVLEQAEVKFALGQHAEHIQALESIRPLIEEEGIDPRRRAAWHYWTGFLHSLVGERPEVPIAYCREAARIAEAGGFEDILAFAECCLAQSYTVAGQLSLAVETGERALARFEAQGDVWWACRALWILNTAALYRGEWERSLEYSRRGLAHGEAVNDGRLKVVGLSRIGSTLIQRGDPAEGLQWCRKALALAPVPYDAAFVKSVEGYGLVRGGQPAAGVAMLADAVAWLESSHLRYGRLLSTLRLAEGHLLLGDTARARALLAEVATISRDFGYRHVEGVAERLLGECLAAGDPDAAAAHLETAQQLLDEVGARNDAAKALVAQAGLREAAGDILGARRRLEHALATFESLGTLGEPAAVRGALARLGG